MSTLRDLEALPLRIGDPERPGADRHVCLIRLVTEDGAVGWGEAATAGWAGSRAIVALVEELGELAAGRGVLARDGLERRLGAAVRPYGGGLAATALAGVDLALWDVRGLLLDARVLDLLGGPAKDRVDAIASARPAASDVAEVAEEAAGWMATGLAGLRVRFDPASAARLGVDAARDVEVVRRVRAAVGDDPLLVVAAGGELGWDVPGAVQRLRGFERHGVAWVEEPLGPWRPNPYRALRRRTTTGLAFAPRAGLDEIHPLAGTGACDVIAFAPGRAEGLTAFRDAAPVLEAERIGIAVRSGATAIGSAAALAIAWASPACRSFEVGPLRDPGQHDLVASPLLQLAGRMPQPEGAGLGVEVLDDVVEALRADRSRP